MGQNWDKFLLLQRKNWLLQWRHPIQTIIEVLAPVLFAALLVLIRGLVTPEERPDKLFTPFRLDGFTPYSDFGIAWSPCENEAIDNIMNNVATIYNFPSDNCYSDGEALETAIWDNETNTLVGIQFSDVLRERDDIDEALDINIRYPSELTNASSQILNTWRTNLMFPLYQVAGPRQPEENEGAQPSYFNEGFLSLQYYISREIIKYHTNESVNMPEVLMQRFPFSSWLDDPLQALLQSFVSLIFMLSFVYPCINTVKVITTEKEKQLKEAMKIMGLPNWLHWTAWFVKVFILLVISIILMLILLQIPWFPDSYHSVFTLADPFLLFVFLILYACATITFCFAISVFFSKANTATTIAGLAWFLSYSIWVFLQDQYHTLSLAQKMLICLASNSAMAFGFQMTLMWEGTAEGMIWSNLFTSVTPDDNFTMAHILLMLIVDTFLYLLIALYVEAIFPGDYGVPKVWYFPFTKSFWCGNNKSKGTHGSINLESDVYEKEPVNLEIGIQINKLTKTFPGKKIAVQSLSLNMFENQITVLLGHNGAGKTTTMCMLTGMITPTNGTAIINGSDITTSMPQIRDSLGLCPQHNILFDELTVAEHLHFFSKLKGLNKKEIDQEIDKYVVLLELVTKRDARAKTLSGGMKRKLCVAIAMCGNSKVVMLDEPTAGMDPAARRALWDMILKLKKGRTILLSTHFMDEADLLGDRIAIMAGGQLQCCGSSFFLKKKYGAGYHLVMDKSRECDVSLITNLLKAYIPNIKMETNIGSELSYILSENNSSIFETMLSDLEQKSSSLGINSYGISLTTMEEVFMKVGADYSQEELNNETDFDEQTNKSESNGSTQYSLDNKVNISGHDFMTGFLLWRNQFLAMFLKRVRITQRNWILLIIQNIIPVAFLVISLIVARMMNIGNFLPSLTLTLNSFTDPIIVITRYDASDNPYYDAYVNLLSTEGRTPTRWDTDNMTEMMLQTTAKYTSRVRMRYIIGATFNENSIISWFNNEPYHSPPIALQYSMNAILQRHTTDNHHIQFINHPLPFRTNTRVTQLSSGQTVGFQLAFNLAFCMAFVTPFYILFLVKERINKSKHLQLVSGVKVSAFWLANIVWDFTTFLLTIICIIITLVAFQEDGFSTPTELGRVCAVLLLFIIATLPVTYLASFLFSAPSSGYTKLSLIKIFLGAALFMVVQILGFDGLELGDVADILHWIFSVVPHYSLAVSFLDISNLHSMITMCEQISATFNAPACLINNVCCIDENYFDINTGVGASLLYMAGVAIISTFILFLIEYGILDRTRYSFGNKPSTIPTNEDTDDSDVIEEKRKVLSGEIRPSEYDVVLKDITKQYSNFLAVNQLCLGIKGYECFGLLGINGAGKTTTFKMMTGDVAISYGTAWIRNLNLKTQMKEVHRHIGYCPQFDALLDDLSGRETLMIYCLLRGIAHQDCSLIIEQLAKDFDFYKHLHKQVKAYSGGNKRKLSAAIALIGDPSIVFLDEPTAGMDPATKRHLWNCLCKFRNDGKCLVLTSHSMEECEALCTRLAIMVNGAFKCLGSVQHLKNKFSEGYMLIVKLKKVGSRTIFEKEEVTPIEKYIQTNFPSAVLQESHQELLTYFIPDTSLTWSKMFGIMERGKTEIHNLEDYSLGQSSLEQVLPMLLISHQYKTIPDENLKLVDVIICLGSTLDYI